MQTITSTPTLTAEPKKNRLDWKQKRQLEDLLKQDLTTTRDATADQLARMTSAKLGFNVSVGNIHGMREFLGLTTPTGPRKSSATEAPEVPAAYVTLARAFVQVLRELKVETPADLLALAGEQPEQPTLRLLAA